MPNPLEEQYIEQEIEEEYGHKGEGFMREMKGEKD